MSAPDMAEMERWLRDRANRLNLRIGHPAREAADALTWAQARIAELEGANARQSEALNRAADQFAFYAVNGRSRAPRATLSPNPTEDE